MRFWQRSRPPKLMPTSRFLFFLASGIGALLYSTNALAAERIILKYGVLRETISVADLATFAHTGDRSSLEGYGISGEDAEKLRTTMTRQIAIDPLLLDRGLNNPIGDVLLDRLGEAIQTPAHTANRQALRAALILSASDDGKVSLLEAIQKYPTPDVEVDAKQLADAYNQINAFAGQIRKVLSVVDLLK